MATIQSSDTTTDDSRDGFEPITDEELGLEPDENEISVQGRVLTSDKLSQFRDWLKIKRADARETYENDAGDLVESYSDLQHIYSKNGARGQYARSKDVDRWFRQEADEYFTVLVSLCGGVPADGMSVAEHSRQFFQESWKLRYIFNEKLGVSWSKDVASLKLLAPKNTAPVEGVDTPPAFTHGHVFLWIAVDAFSDDMSESQLQKELVPYLEKHIESVEGATAENNPPKKAISVQRNVSAEVETPLSVSMRGSNLDFEKGNTTALPHEVGANLPMLKTQSGSEHLDALDCAEWVTWWCAQMRFANGTNGERGLTLTNESSRFKEIADQMKKDAGSSLEDVSFEGTSVVRKGEHEIVPVGCAAGDDESSVGTTDRSGDFGSGKGTPITEDERDFIRNYVEAGASADPADIRESIESNEFTNRPKADEIIGVIQFVYWIQRASWVSSETDIRRQAEGNGLPPELVLQIV